MTLVIFILILSILVLVHEAGHFFVAKRNGIRVEEFGLGIPPRVYGIKRGETLYSLNALPFGGFVKLTGEDPSEQESAENDPRSFAHKTWLQRIAVLVAGVTMNFILAVVLYYILMFSTGFKSLTLPVLFDYRFKFGNLVTHDTVISGFSEDSVLSEAGGQVGEKVVSINGQQVKSVTDIKSVLRDKAGQIVEVELDDLNTIDEQTRTLEVTPSADEEEAGVLGIYLARFGTLYYTEPLQKAFSGFLHSYNMLAYSGSIFGELISLSFRERTLSPVSEGVSGPVGIYSVVGSILDLGGEQAVLSMLDFMALMSLSLALLNILPFPALDGGRVFFILLEKVRGKPVSAELEANIHKWGILVLLALIFLISIKDLLRLF
jgi:regulator of sigma E protease